MNVVPDTFHEEFQKYLANYSHLRNLIAGRVYAGFAEQNQKLDYIAYTLITIEAISHFRGGSGLINETYQIDTVSGDQGRGRQIINVLRNALEGFEGFMGQNRVQSIYLETALGIPEYIPEGNTEAVFYQYTSEYTVVREIQIPVLNN